jgi:hypothetical protein
MSTQRFYVVITAIVLTAIAMASFVAKAHAANDGEVRQYARVAHWSIRYNAQAQRCHAAARFQLDQEVALGFESGARDINNTVMVFQSPGIDTLRTNTKFPVKALFDRAGGTFTGNATTSVDSTGRTYLMLHMDDKMYGYVMAAQTMLLYAATDHGPKLMITIDLTHSWEALLKVAECQDAVNGIQPREQTPQTWSQAERRFRM